MLSGHAIGFRERSSEEFLLADPVAEIDDDEEALSGKVLYRASFEELAKNHVQCDTLVWFMISLLLVLAWGVGVLMLLYIPYKRYVLQKELSSRTLYVTENKIFYKAMRPSFIPFLGIVKIEKQIPLHLVIDIIIEQGCLQSSYGLHTFRIESIAHGKAAPVDELQFQGVSSPELLRKGHKETQEGVKKERTYNAWVSIPCCGSEMMNPTPTNRQRQSAGRLLTPQRSGQAQSGRGSTQNHRWLVADRAREIPRRNRRQGHRKKQRSTTTQHRVGATQHRVGAEQHNTGSGLSNTTQGRSRATQHSFGATQHSVGATQHSVEATQHRVGAEQHNTGWGQSNTTQGRSRATQHSVGAPQHGRSTAAEHRVGATQYRVGAQQHNHKVGAQQHNHRGGSTVSELQQHNTGRDTHNSGGVAIGSHSSGTSQIGGLSRWPSKTGVPRGAREGRTEKGKRVGTRVPTDLWSQ